MMERLLGEEGRRAFQEFEESGDETAIRAVFDRLLDPPPHARQDEDGDTVGFLSEQRLAEERERMRELTSRPPDSWSE
jgi:hypothetical protein